MISLAADIHDFSKILLIKLSAVGDVVHTIPVLNKLRRRYPAAQIDWLVTPPIAELLRYHPAITNVIEFAREEWQSPWRLTPFATYARLGRKLARGRLRSRRRHARPAAHRTADVCNRRAGARRFRPAAPGGVVGFRPRVPAACAQARLAGSAGRKLARLHAPHPGTDARCARRRSLSHRRADPGPGRRPGRFLVSDSGCGERAHRAASAWPRHRRYATAHARAGDGLGNQALGQPQVCGSGAAFHAERFCRDLDRVTARAPRLRRGRPARPRCGQLRRRDQLERTCRADPPLDHLRHQRFRADAPCRRTWPAGGERIRAHRRDLDRPLPPQERGAAGESPLLSLLFTAALPLPAWTRVHARRVGARGDRTDGNDARRARRRAGTIEAPAPAR